MNIRGVMDAIDEGMKSLGYSKDSTREGTSPSPSKSYRLLVEGFSSSVSTRGASAPNSYDADVSVILSSPPPGGHPEDATIEIAERAEILASALIDWIDRNYLNSIQMELVEARGYIGEGRIVKMAVRFQVFYDYSAAN